MKAVLATDAGMHAVWERQAFAAVADYDSWSRELEDDVDIARPIAAYHLVPINIGGDGAFLFDIRMEPDTTHLTAEEEARVLVRSEPYKPRSQGSVYVSGIEYVHNDPDKSRA